METKTFRAENMLAALELVKKELGSDAIVISVRQVLAAPAWQVWQKPMIEVLAMKGKGIPKIATERKEAPESSNPVYDRKDILRGNKLDGYESGRRTEISQILIREAEKNNFVSKNPSRQNSALKNIDDETTNKSQLFARIIDKKQEPPLIIEKYKDFLLNQGIDVQLINLISKNCLEVLSEQAYENDQRVQEYFKIQLAASLRYAKQKNHVTRAICLVGSSGCGKTSVCAKLIIRISNILGKKVIWVCADTNKISAIAEARIYAETIGIPLKLAYTPEELSSIVKVSELEANYVVIDTSAINPHSEENLVEMKSLMQAIPQIPVWLVAAASTPYYVQSNVYNVIKSFNLRGLVLTKMDETSRFGDAFSFAWKSQIPLTYFSNGPKIIDDLKPADSDYLVNALFKERQES